MSAVTQILSRLDAGDPLAPGELLPLIYEELRKLAAARLAHENPGQTLQATALVHEAYLRLVGSDGSARWDNRGHFFAAAAEAMRRILVEQARAKNAVKRGGMRGREDYYAVPEPAAAENCDLADILALDEALSNLAVEAPLKAELVKLRYFAGLSVDEAARALNISEATAKRYWTFARAWLFQALAPPD